MTKQQRIICHECIANCNQDKEPDKNGEQGKKIKLKKLNVINHTLLMALEKNQLKRFFQNR